MKPSLTIRPVFDDPNLVSGSRLARRRGWPSQPSLPSAGPALPQHFTRRRSCSWARRSPPVLRVFATPQHIDAWRSGAIGEREVGIRLDRLRVAGVLTLHDRRVLGRRTIIDHVAASAAGVFVIDTKNVVGKVIPTRNGRRVAGQRRDEMLTGVPGQIAAVRQALGDQRLSSDVVHGVLCFSRKESVSPGT